MGVVAHWRALVRLSEQQDASDDALGHPLAHWFLCTWGLFTACNRRQSELGRSEFESGEVVQKNEGDASVERITFFERKTRLELRQAGVCLLRGPAVRDSPDSPSVAGRQTV